MAKIKGDSDKDLLFSKILPALNDNAFSAIHTEKEISVPLTEINLPADANTEALSALRSKLFGRSDEYTPDTYVTINVMENLVLNHIDAALRRFNACTCDRCRSDVAAHALNNLPPQYIVSQSEFLSIDPDSKLTKQVMDALVTAVLHVRSHPQH